MEPPLLLFDVKMTEDGWRIRSGWGCRWTGNQSDERCECESPDIALDMLIELPTDVIWHNIKLKTLHGDSGRPHHSE